MDELSDASKPKRKSGGSRKGIPNRKTDALIDELGNLDFNVVREKVWVYREAKGLIQATNDQLKHNEKLQKEYSERIAAWEVEHDAWTVAFRDWTRDGKQGPQPAEPPYPARPALVAVEDNRVGLLTVCENVNKDFMKYVYPQRKAVEMSGPNDTPLNFTDLLKDVVHVLTEPSGKE